MGPCEALVRGKYLTIRPDIAEQPARKQILAVVPGSPTPHTGGLYFKSTGLVRLIRTASQEFEQSKGGQL